MFNVNLLLRLLSALIILLILIILKSFYIIIKTHNFKPKNIKKQNSEKSTLAIFLGSGGHTAEMIRILGGVNFERYNSRIYFISSGDQLSETKALELERRIGSGEFRIVKIPRARKVHQSYLTSPFSTLHSLLFCLYHVSLRPLIYGHKGQRRLADLILLNGPGSCVPIVYSVFLSRILSLPSPSLIYIESLARTRKLSLSAILVRPIVDRFFVQWESLRKELIKGKNEKGLKLKAKVEFEGWLV